MKGGDAAPLWKCYATVADGSQKQHDSSSLQQSQHPPNFSLRGRPHPTPH